METSQRINNLIDWMLKVGIILFLGSVLLEVYTNQTPDNEFWFWTLRILLLVLFVVLSAVVLVLDKLQYYIFGFFLVLRAVFDRIKVIVFVPIFSYFKEAISLMFIPLQKKIKIQ